MDRLKIANWAATLVVLGVIGVVAYPLFVRPRETRHGSCISNMKQLGTGMQIYLGDYDDWLPPHGWNNEVYPYTKNTMITTCPQVADRGLKNGYAMNWEVMGRLSTKLDASKTPLFFEIDVFAPDVIASVNARSKSRHAKGSSICYLDSQAKYVPAGP